MKNPMKALTAERGWSRDALDPPSLRRIAVPMALYVVLAFVTVGTPEGSPWRLLAILGMIALFLGTLVADFLAILRLDELGRRIYGEAAVLAVLVAIGLAAIVGILPLAGLSVPRLKPTWLPVALWIIWGITLRMVRSRYR